MVLAALYPYLMVVAKQLVQEVQSFRGHQVLVFGAHELSPRLPTVPPYKGLQLRVQLDAILAEVRVQLICAQHLR